MAVKKKASETKKEETDELLLDDARVETKPPITARVVHISPENIIGTLNGAVANINAVFQLRDHLQTEINVLKSELALGNEVRIEAGKLESLKREQDEFVYEYQIKKTRLERELKDMEEELKVKLDAEESAHEEKLAVQADEQKMQFKAQSDSQNLKLKLEREDQERKIKLEREDWEREKTQFAVEKTSFDEKAKRLEERSATLRDELSKELNRDNAHAIEVLNLNHQKDLELLKSELNLEQAHRAKFEAMLKDSREQNEKLSDQLTALSREALSSASTSSMASKLKDIVTQMSSGGTARPL